jgi:hypothetical protein
MMDMQSSTPYTFATPAPSLLARLPLERGGRSIPRTKALIPGSHQLRGVAKVSAIESPMAQDIPPALNQVHTGSAFGQEVEDQPKLKPR